MAAQPALSPVPFFSHGSTMMLGEESAAATYWKKCGDEALTNGIEHVVIMGAHWATLNDQIEVSANPHLEKSPIAYVHPSKYASYSLKPHLAFRQEVEDLFTAVLPGRDMCRAAAALMKSPAYRDPHAIDDHSMQVMFVVGAWVNGDAAGVLAAEDWELTNIANSQFTLGKWSRQLAG